MDELIRFWVELITSCQKNIDEIPLKIKSAVMLELEKIGYLNKSDLEDVINAKVVEMSLKCKQIILSGIDVDLTDGHTYHFSLDLTDQTMISKLNERALSGNTFLPWHWDNGSCMIFSKEDIIKINDHMEDYITYHTTYFNSLKAYINSMNNIAGILEVDYGIQIPEEYQSDVLKLINQSMSEKEK